MKRALIVDGQPDNLPLLRALLEGHGFEVAAARHGVEALALARQRPPDMAISDLLMPVMDGYTLLRHWKADPQLQAIPLIVYAATSTDPEDEKLALELGADAFIRKPAEPAVFLARLDQVCARIKQRQLPSAAPAATEEPAVLREYSEALVRRLEEKTRALAFANEELREREARLAASERRFRAMVEKSSDAIVLMDAQGRIFYRTSVGPRIFGHHDDAVLGHTFAEFLHPEELPAVAERFGRLLKTPGDSFFVEFRYRRPDGQWGYADGTATNWLEDPDIGAVVVNAREIPARKEAEARVAHEKRLRQLLLESVGDGVYGLDTDGNVSFENAAALQMFGSRADDMLGQHAHTLVHHHHADGRPYPVEDCPIYRTLRDGQTRHVVDEVFFRRDGSSFPVEYTCNALRDAAGRLDGVVVSFRDITARQAAEAALRQSKAQLSAVFEHALDGILIADVASKRFLFCNPRICEMLGYDREEVLTLDVSRIHPPEDLARVVRVFETQAREERALGSELPVRRKDGSVFCADINSFPITFDGRACLVGFFRDISERKRAAARVEHLGRLYATLNEINQTIVRVKSREELFPAICRAAVEHGGFAQGCIRLLDRATMTVTTVAMFGPGADKLDGLQIDLKDARFKDGLMSRTLATGRLVVTSDVQRDPTLSYWRASVEARGLHAVAAVPFRCGGDIAGFLVLASTEVDYFADPELQGLVTEMATDVSFALDAIEADAQRRRAELAEMHERSLTDATIRSLPGIFYLFNAEGRFIRWNENFETVSGYTGEEIARLHPTDLFTGEEKELIRQRIGRVFAEGESDAEAHFTAKAGTRTPYYFTGRLVLLDGQPHLVGMGVDLTARKRAEARVEHLGRLYATLSEVNQAIVRVKTRGELFQAIGQAAVDHGRFALAWIGVLDRATRIVTGVAARVRGAGAERLVTLTYDLGKPGLQNGLMGQALASGRLALSRDLQSDPNLDHVRWVAEAFGLRAAAAVPFFFQGEVAGFLVFASEEADFFAAADLQNLVVEMATDISFALDAMEAEARRRRAEAEVRLLQALALGVGAAASLSEGLAFVLRQVCETTGWAMGQVWLPSGDRSRLECHPVWHRVATGLESFRQASEAMQFGPGQGLVGGVWQTQRSTWLPQLAGPGFLRMAAAQQANLRAGLGVPVLAHGEVVLVLEFFTFQPSEEDPRRVDLIAAAAAQIGTLIERQQAAEQVRQRNAELERFNRATVGREVRMVELKQEVNELCRQAGRAPRYRVDFAEAGGEEMPR